MNAPQPHNKASKNTGNPQQRHKTARFQRTGLSVASPKQGLSGNTYYVTVNSAGMGVNRKQKTAAGLLEIAQWSVDNLWEGDAATLHPRRQARRGKGVHFTLLHLWKQVHIGQLKRLDLAAEEQMLQPSREGSFPVSVKHLFTSSVRFRSGRHPGNQSSPGAPNTCLQNLPFGVIALSTYYGGMEWGRRVGASEQEHSSQKAKVKHYGPRSPHGWLTVTGQTLHLPRDFYFSSAIFCGDSTKVLWMRP